MGANDEWKRFMHGLTIDELFTIGTSYDMNEHVDVLNDVARRAAELPPVDFSPEPYMDLMASLVDRIVKDPQAYFPRTYRFDGTVFGGGKGTSRPNALVLKTDQVLRYFSHLHAAHKVTQGVGREAREKVLSRNEDGENPWDSLQQMGYRESLETLFTREEAARIILAQGMPKETIQHIWHGADPGMQRSGISLGGDDGNPIIPVVYASGYALPEELIGMLSPGGKDLLERSARAEDPVRLSSRECAYIMLRQNANMSMGDRVVGDTALPRYLRRLGV